jgi:PleD family two-component response regulator
LVSRAGLNSPPTCQLRQGGKNDAVNQQPKEFKMKKMKLLVVRPSDDRKTIYKNLIKYLEQQGIRVTKGGKNEK